MNDVPSAILCLTVNDCVASFRLCRPCGSHTSLHAPTYTVTHTHSHIHTHTNTHKHARCVHSQIMSINGVPAISQLSPLCAARAWSTSESAPPLSVTTMEGPVLTSNVCVRVRVCATVCVCVCARVLCAVITTEGPILTGSVYMCVSVGVRVCIHVHLSTNTNRRCRLARAPSQTHAQDAYILMHTHTYTSAHRLLCAAETSIVAESSPLLSAPATEVLQQHQHQHQQQVRAHAQMLRKTQATWTLLVCAHLLPQCTQAHK